jgi:outer membrane protein with beta-barrel domain
MKRTPMLAGEPLLVARPLLAARFSMHKLCLTISATVVLLVAAALPARAQTPFYFGAHLTGHRLSELNDSRIGYGFLGGYDAYLPFISLESEVNFFPTSSSGDLGETQAFFGLKFGKKIAGWGAFVKARPGFTHFGGGAFPTRLTQQTKFALDLGAGIEHDLVPKVSVRLDVGDTKIYYGDAQLLPFPGGPPGPRLGTHDTFQGSLGLVVHF